MAGKRRFKFATGSYSKSTRKYVTKAQHRLVHSKGIFVKRVTGGGRVRTKGRKPPRR